MTNLATIGHNNPPEPTPFEAVETRINDLYEEAKQWLDGEPVTTQQQADALNNLEGEIRKAAKDAEALRKAEVKPLDDAKAEVQARYNPLIGETKAVTGKTVKALDAVRAALKPYLLELDRLQREAAEKARKEAEEKQREAMQAMQQRDRSNLEEREQAEQLFAEAKELEKDATKLEAAKPQAKGNFRATGLRTVYRAEMTSYREAAAWAYTNKREELTTFLNELAEKEVRAGRRTAFQGFNVIEERTI